ncbi:MAG: GTPase ObgE, partial [Tenuifilaceae bacterium]
TLLNELMQYNPELMDKRRILAITKCDLIDNELTKEMEKDMPNIPHLFISSVANKGLDKLKDLLWAEINHFEP